MFSDHTEVFPCLPNEKPTCYANKFNETESATPATAFGCAAGSTGVLCATCSKDMYFKGTKCVRCDQTAVSPGFRAALIGSASLLIGYVAFKCVVRRHAAAITKVLHKMRRTLHKGMSRKKRRRQARRRSLQHKRHQLWRKTHGLSGTEEETADAGGKEKDDEKQSWLGAFFTKPAIQCVHSVVKSATKGIFAHTETVRIVMNACKIVNHLYSTLVYCLQWPQSMKMFLGCVSLFAFDLFGETRMPCVVSGFDYYSRVLVAIFAPLTIGVLLVAGGIVRAYFTPPRDRKSEDSVIMRGLWNTAAANLFIIDLIYPVITRTLLQFFTCRDLGEAGKWLEVDYSARRDSAEHASS